MGIQQFDSHVSGTDTEHCSPTFGKAATLGDNVIPLWNCSQSDEVTDYDLRNLYLYGNLLQAESEGASERRMVEAFFRIGFDRHPVWALNVVRAHLARARWMKKNVFPLLDW